VQIRDTRPLAEARCGAIGPLLRSNCEAWVLQASAVGRSRVARYPRAKPWAVFLVRSVVEPCLLLATTTIGTASLQGALEPEGCSANISRVSRYNPSLTGGANQRAVGCIHMLSGRVYIGTI
jgi:hypothetical protein